jgi:signal peptidase I
MSTALVRDYGPIVAPRSRLRASRRVFTVLLSAVLLTGWWVALRPTALGGATAYLFVSGQSMEPRMHSGDLAITRVQDHYAVGDVIAYRIPRGDVGAGRIVIHRIVGGSEQAGFRTRGDNRTADDLWRPRQRDVVGKAVWFAPDAARYLAALRSPFMIAVLVGLAAWFLIPGPRPTHS